MSHDLGHEEILCLTEFYNVCGVHIRENKAQASHAWGLIDYLELEAASKHVW